MRIKGLWTPHDPAPELLSAAPPCLQSGLSGISWQEWQGSNLRPPVLETGALPIELHSCREPRVAAGSRRFKHRPCPDCKGEPVLLACSSQPFSFRLAHQVPGWRAHPAINKSKRETL